MYEVIAGTALLGAILNADRQAVAQSMLGRPLSAGFLTGLLWQDVNLGLWLGLWAELWWSGKLPLGGIPAPNGTLAVVGTVSGIALARKLGFLNWPETREGVLAVITLGGMMLPPLGYLPTKLESVHRGWSLKLSIALDKRELSGLKGHRFLGQLAALSWTVATGFVYIIFSAALVLAFTFLAASWSPEFIRSGLVTAFPVITLLGFASVLTNSPRLTGLPFYAAGLLAGLLTLSSAG